jgi:hypothetical protein
LELSIQVGIFYFLSIFGFVDHQFFMSINPYL